MKRNAINDLIQWKSGDERKPMVLKGARQVGKTWQMKEFGQRCCQQTVYFNFDEEDELESIFEVNKDPRRIIEWLVSAGMLNRVCNVSKMEHPLAAFDKLDQFKLFVFDTGLLSRWSGSTIAPSC